MLDTTYESRTDRRADLAETRIPDILQRLASGEEQSFRRCASMAEVLYRELRAWFRSKPPFTWRLPTYQQTVSQTDIDSALVELTSFREMSRDRAFACALVLLAAQPPDAAV